MSDRVVGRPFWLLVLMALAVPPMLLLLACGGRADEASPVEAAGSRGLSTVAAGFGGAESSGAATATALPTPALDLHLAVDGVTVGPLPLQASYPFTVTAVVENDSGVPAVDVPVLVHILAEQKEVGYTPFLAVVTATVPATGSVAVDVPVRWNLAGGTHQVWVEVNRLPELWQDGPRPQPEAKLRDNAALLEVMVAPFDAYTSDLCRGRVDVEVDPGDVVPDVAAQQVAVIVHNVGNRAVYNLPVVVMAGGQAGIAYTPAIAPCGGTAEVIVALDRPLAEGTPLTVEVNPPDWTDGLAEDDFENNAVTLAVGLTPGQVVPPGGGLDEYDFGLAAGDVESPELWILEVTVHNQGTRDAAMVPVQVENEAGRKVSDAIPLVRGSGLGVAALRIGYLWTHGGKLTITVNPPDAKGAYPETNRDDNTTTFTLP